MTNPPVEDFTVRSVGLQITLPPEHFANDDIRSYAERHNREAFHREYGIHATTQRWFHQPAYDHTCGTETHRMPEMWINLCEGIQGSTTTPVERVL